jgi:hypothetical protein
MKKLAVISLCATLLLLLGAVVSAQAQGTEIFYVRTDYNPDGNLCEDGSETCPFNTVREARYKGNQICEGRTFEVHLWNPNTGTYEYYQTLSGRKPILGMGSPVATGMLIVLIALVGAVLLLIALRWQRKKAA